MWVSLLIISIHPKLTNLEKAEGDVSHTAGYTLINKSNFFLACQNVTTGDPPRKNINQLFLYRIKAMNNKGGLQL